MPPDIGFVVKIRHTLPCLAAVFGIEVRLTGDIIIAYRSYAWPLPFIVIVKTYSYFDFLISFHKERLVEFHRIVGVVCQFSEILLAYYFISLEYNRFGVDT